MTVSEFDLIIAGAILASVGHIFSFEKKDEGKSFWGRLALKRLSLVGRITLGLMLVTFVLSWERTQELENKEFKAIAYRDSTEQARTTAQARLDSLLQAVRDSLKHQSKIEQQSNDSTVKKLTQVIDNIAYANNVLTASYERVNAVNSIVAEIGFPIDNVDLKMHFTSAKKDIPFNVETVFNELNTDFVTVTPTDTARYLFSYDQIEHMRVSRRDMFNTFLNKQCFLQLIDPKTEEPYYSFYYLFPWKIQIEPFQDSIFTTYTWRGKLVTEQYLPYKATFGALIGKTMELIVNAGSQGYHSWAETTDGQLILMFENGYILPFKMHKAIDPYDLPKDDLLYGDRYRWFLSSELSSYLVYRGTSSGKRN